MSLEIVGMTQLTWVPAVYVDTAPKSKVYLSWDDRQDEIMRKIMTIYNQGDGIELDPMYGAGAIYTNVPEPRFKYDLNPKGEDVLEADARHLPIFDNSISSMLLDPPFVTGRSKTGTIKDRYTKIPTMKELHELYQDLIKEAYRVLAPKGLLVFKCQAVVSSGRKHPIPHDVMEYAKAAGFLYEDELTLVRHNPQSQDHMYKKNGQQHTRSATCPFFVFRKGKLGIAAQRKRAVKVQGVTEL